MLVKTYGIYDSVQDEYVRTFTAANDEDAKRSVNLIVLSQGFDDVTYKDRSVHHLFDFDSATGKVVDNDVHQICLFATAIEARKQDDLEKQVKEKIATQEFMSELKDVIIAKLQGDIHNERKES